MKRSIFAIVGCLLVAACASAPSADQQMRAYYGPPPRDSEQTIRDYMSHILKDPMSAIYQFQRYPQKMYIREGMFSGSFKFGWGTCASVNAKNGFGGYVGEHVYFFLIQDDNVIYYQDAAFTKLCG